MLAVRTPGAPQTARVIAACGSAFPFERQGRLLRSRSISGLCSRSLSFRPTTSLSTLRSGRYRTPRKTWYAAARSALLRTPSQATEFNALARRSPHRSVRAQFGHTAWSRTALLQRRRRLVLDGREHGGRLPAIGWLAAR